MRNASIIYANFIRSLVTSCCPDYRDIAKRYFLRVYEERYIVHRQNCQTIRCQTSFSNVVRRNGLVHIDVIKQSFRYLLSSFRIRVQSPNATNQVGILYFRYGNLQYSTYVKRHYKYQNLLFSQQFRICYMYLEDIYRNCHPTRRQETKSYFAIVHPQTIDELSRTTKQRFTHYLIK